jgi:CRISPR-associated protein Cas2
MFNDIFDETSGYKSMWLMVMFDLPVDTEDARRDYTTFRKKLIKRGFIMLQFSVYARFCTTEEASKVHRKYVRSVLPKNGQVRLLSVTDRQFGKMEVFVGKKSVEPEKQPEQLQFL